MERRQDTQGIGYVEEGAALAALHDLDAKALGHDGGGRYDVIVIGAGQSGLALGYHLARRGLRFVILDAGERIGDAWRNRWDSLRLFTPAAFDNLPGMPFPADDPFYFPTKDEMGDYLESYAKRFDLPVRLRTRVTRLRRRDRGYVVTASGVELEADHVVVAMAGYQKPKVPGFADELGEDVVQLHSSEYRNPSQLREGGVLIVGAGNSGAEIAKELAGRRRVWMSGPVVGQIPWEVGGFFGRLLLTRLLLRFVFHRVLTIRTWLGRKAYPKVTVGSGPLIRVKEKHLAALGVERVARTTGVSGGRPHLADGRVLDVANVIWCTGYHPGFSWIDIPVIEPNGKPRHDGGVVEGEPGLYFLGLHFLYSLSSGMVHGVGRDAGRIAGVIAERQSASGRAVRAGERASGSVGVAAAAG